MQTRWSPQRPVICLMREQSRRMMTDQEQRRGSCLLGLGGDSGRGKLSTWGVCTPAPVISLGASSRS